MCSSDLNQQLYKFIFTIKNINCPFVIFGGGKKINQIPLNIMKRNLLALFFFSVTTILLAQFPGGMGGFGGMGGGKDGKMNIPSIAKVFGKVVDAKTGKPIEYASVAILRFNKDSVVNGQVTKSNGEFVFENMAFGGFRIRISFIGYKTYEEKLYVSFNPLEKDLGNISLSADEAIQLIQSKRAPALSNSHFVNWLREI